MSSSSSGLKPSGFQMLDASWAAGLLSMLVLVFALDRGRTPAPVSDSQNTPTVTERVVKLDTVVEEVVPPRKLAVTIMDQGYDDMGRLLESLGKQYPYKKLNLSEILDKKAISDLDVLFATCSPVPAAWGDDTGQGGGDRPGTVNVRIKPEVIERIKENLHDFVNNGGTFYASDWQFSLVEWAFPEFIDMSRRDYGAKQSLVATAVDESLRKIVGERLDLNFDMPGWRPAMFREDKVTVLLRGDFLTLNGNTVNAPLLAKFSFGKGTVIFTSFHNERQNSELETKLLKYLVFTTILAKTEANMTETLVQGGFKPTERSILSVSAEAPSITATYHCTRSETLRFNLGFENGSAKMKLSVVGPDGSSFEQEGASPLVVEIPQPMIGDWKYTIVAVKVPSSDFPYALTIGQKEKP